MPRGIYKRKKKWTQKKPTSYTGLGLCSYGCTQPARFQMGNSKLCCADHPTRCSAARIFRPQMSLMIEPEFQTRIQKINLEKHGWATPFENSDILARARQTCKERYGVENPFAAPEVKETIRQTNLIRYGCENPFQNELIKKKSQKTWQHNYGVSNPQQSKLIRRQSEETCLEKYGTRYPLQNAEVARRAFQRGAQKRGYTLPSGRSVKLAGYESLVLDEFLQTGMVEGDFDFGLHMLPAIFYWDPKLQKRRRYYPDFFVPKWNWIIEVKSKYTYQHERTTNLAKFRACRQQGYAYSLIIRKPSPKLVLLRVSHPHSEAETLDTLASTSSFGSK